MKVGFAQGATSDRSRSGDTGRGRSESICRGNSPPPQAPVSTKIPTPPPPPPLPPHVSAFASLITAPPASPVLAAPVPAAAQVPPPPAPPAPPAQTTPPAQPVIEPPALSSRPPPTNHCHRRLPRRCLHWNPKARIPRAVKPLPQGLDPSAGNAADQEGICLSWTTRTT